MRRAVRAFLGERTLCSDFQLRDGLFPEPVLRLFDQGLALKIPRNVFSAWMVARLPGAAGSRPVDQLDDLPLLQNSVAVFADMFRLRPDEKRR